jgi:predicted enzyme related to lactoylglutathione lyase
MHTRINWFEIPVTDMARATRFYETLFTTKLKEENMGSGTLAIFCDPKGEGVGCLMKGDNMEPTSAGTINYLDAGASLQIVLDRVAAAGGKIVLDKFTLPRDLGVIAHVIDTEGNRIGLHATN